MAELPLQLRDLKFALFEHIKVQENSDLDAEDMEAILEAYAKMTTDLLAPINEVIDRKGCTHHEDGSVTTNPELREAYAKYREDEWGSMSTPEEFDGQALPPGLICALDEILIASCCAFGNYVSLSRACVNMLAKSGSEDQKKRWIPPMSELRWQGTMCLTEAGAGSDVGASLTKATPVEGQEGMFKIEGQKVFITSGDHDLTENFVHIVLARIEGDPEVVKGLSIFIVPKFRVQGDGSLGEYNNVFCSGIEEKMGIHGSVTTTLDFGQSGECLGELIGRPGDGIRIMFSIMNEERLVVGAQGQGLGSIAYAQALQYSRERSQGSSIAKGKSISKEKVAIIEHPDVRRLLLYSKAQTESLRALFFWVGKMLAELESEDMPKDERKAISKLIGLLTPICKSHGSEVGFQVCSQAMQVYGGYGYCSDFPVEQYLRDSRIACVYEGTNGIQAIDLLFRKVLGDQGATLKALLEGPMETVSAAVGAEPMLAELKAPFDKARGMLGKLGLHLGKTAAGGDLGMAALGATPFLSVAGNLICAHLMLEQALIARAKLEELGAPLDEGLAAFAADNVEAAFYASKIETTRFHIHQILSENDWRASQILRDDRSAISALAFPG